MYPYITLGPLTLGTYGICAAVAFLMALFVYKADLIRHGFPGKIAEGMVVITTLTGLIGAKLYYILEKPSVLAGGIVNALTDVNGLSWLGGLLAGTAAICLLRLRHHIPLLVMFDMAGVIGAITYGFGRIGCFMAGDGDYGTPTSLPWGMSFPRGTVPTIERVHPTPLYEAAFSFALFWFLWRLGARRPAPGVVAGSYLILSGLARFTVEFIKLNPRVWLGLTNSQIVSVISVIAGCVLLVMIRAAARKDLPQPGEGSAAG